MQTVNLLTIEWQLRVKGSNFCHYIVDQTLSLTKNSLKNLIFSLKPGLQSNFMADIGKFFQELDLPPFQNKVSVDPVTVTSRRTQSSE